MRKTETVRLKSIEDTESIKLNTGAVALGLFDGMHAAHRALISAALTSAQNNGAPLAVFTFSSDSPSHKGKALYTDKDKLDLIESLGADIAVLADFEALCELSAEEFTEKVLFGMLGARSVVCGYNFRFGKGAVGNANRLRELAKEHGAEAILIDEITDGGETISTSRIKSLVGKGEVREAAKLLSLPYFISGNVCHGNGMGRAMGIPTVNIPLREGACAPKGGVYSSVVRVGEKAYLGLTNVGSCPTFGERAIHTETLILDFDGDLYGKEIRIFFIDYLRDERRFSGAEELVMQINIDKNKAIELLGDLKWQEIGQSLL